MPNLGGGCWVDEARSEPLGLTKRIQLTWIELAGAWLRLLRLQFYPMAWVAYTIGALAARHHAGGFSPRIYWLGYLCLFLTEALTVLSNEWFDQGTDRLNQNAGPFNGGSRVLVERDLDLDSVRRAMPGLALLLGLGLAALAAALPTLAGPGFWCLIVLCVIALSYTIPPLKFIYRGLGELDVAFTHSIGVILCGYLLQSGDWRNPYPWLIGTPLFFATLVAITLSALPDQVADAAVSKQTLAVLLGRKGATWAALSFTTAAAICGVAWQWRGLYGGISGLAIWLAVIHGLLLARAILRYLREGAPCARIDGIMTLALTYLLWFGLIPLAFLS